ncbi:hypothetical protein HK097_007502, partial [Rhizophlyctis rosea]
MPTPTDPLDLALTSTQKDPLVAPKNGTSPTTPSPTTSLQPVSPTTTSSVHEPNSRAESYSPSPDTEMPQYLSHLKGGGGLAPRKQPPPTDPDATSASSSEGEQEDDPMDRGDDDEDEASDSNSTPLQTPSDIVMPAVTGTSGSVDERRGSSVGIPTGSGAMAKESAISGSPAGGAGGGSVNAEFHDGGEKTERRVPVGPGSRGNAAKSSKPISNHSPPNQTTAPGALLLGEATGVTRDNIVRLYESFLRKFHFKNPAAKHCRLTEHFAKFESPPKNQKRSFETYDLWGLIWEVGGVDGIKSWSDIARRLGFDPRGTNIAARIKDWMTYHHIHSFFDYLLQIPNDFFLHP